MQEIRSSNSPVVTGNCGPNKSRAQRQCSLKLVPNLNYFNVELTFNYNGHFYCVKDLHLYTANLLIY